jgi:hypothetical protein
MVMHMTWGSPDQTRGTGLRRQITVAARGRDIKGLRGRWLPQDTPDKIPGSAALVGERGLTWKRMNRATSPVLLVGDYKTRRQIHVIGVPTTPASSA